MKKISEDCSHCTSKVSNKKGQWKATDPLLEDAGVLCSRISPASCSFDESSGGKVPKQIKPRGNGREQRRRATRQGYPRGG